MLGYDCGVGPGLGKAGGNGVCWARTRPFSSEPLPRATWLGVWGACSAQATTIRVATAVPPAAASHRFIFAPSSQTGG